MRTRRVLIAAFALAILFVLSAPRPAQGSASVSVSFFHDQLSPHGRWVVAGSYGDVWVPGGVATGWAPYVDGQWVWTDYGWTWVSYDPWGDIPYHYGTWAYVSDYGWSWVPGTVWAPAWVTWAYSDNYIGWAPVPPTFVFSTGGYFGGPVVLAASSYCFVPTSQFVGVNVSSVRVPLQQNNTIFAGTTRATRFQVSNGIVHTAGLDPARIERVTGQHLQRASMSQVHAQPTTVAAAGFSKSRSVGVVVPAKTRSQELRTASSSHTAEKHSSATATRETHTNTAAKVSPRTATSGESNHVAQKAKPKAKPEHSTTSAQSTSRSAHQKPVTEEKSHAAKPQPKAPAEHAKSSSTTAQKHVTTSSPRTAEVRKEKAPQAKVAEQPHQKQPQARTEQRAATNHVESAKPASPKEHAAPPQRVASNQSNHHAASPPKVKNPPPPKERPKEEKPKGSE